MILIKIFFQIFKWLRSLASLLEYKGSVSSATWCLTTIFNYSAIGSDASSGLLWILDMLRMHIHMHIPIYTYYIYMYICVYMYICRQNSLCTLNKK